jgi:hypothetical protein
MPHDRCIFKLKIPHVLEIEIKRELPAPLVYGVLIVLVAIAIKIVIW